MQTARGGWGCWKNEADDRKAGLSNESTVSIQAATPVAGVHGELPFAVIHLRYLFLRSHRATSTTSEKTDRTRPDHVISVLAEVRPSISMGWVDRGMCGKANAKQCASKASPAYFIQPHPPA